MSSKGLSVFVQDTQQDTPLIFVNADVPRNPASTMKLVTTYVALEELKPNYHWKSEVYLGGPLRDGHLDGDLYIKGYGDPYLVMERYWLLLNQLQQKGLQRIDGDLVIDNTYYDVPAGDRGAFDGQPRRSYNVTPDAFLVNLQTVSFRFDPDPVANRINIIAEPLPANLEIANRLSLASGSCRGFQRGITVTFPEPPESGRVIFSGDFSRNCRGYRISRSVLDAPTFAYGVFRGLWEQAGATLTGGLRVEPVPEGLDTFHSIDSLALGDIIRLINKWSNNVMARHLLLTLGVERYGPPATVEAGRLAVKYFLQEQGLDFPELQIDNGAGLSREARISVASLGKLLMAANGSDFRSEFVSSLPLSGLDGTMRRRFRNTELTGSMHIKTGRLDEVFAMAGYVHSRSGREFVVVAIQNDTDADRGPGEEAQSALLKWVYQQ